MAAAEDCAIFTVFSLIFTGFTGFSLIFAGLLDACEAFICANAKTLVMDEEFLHLPAHLLESLAQRDDLAITELNWFEAVLRWVEADRSGRAEAALARITPHIRIPLLTVRDIMKLVKPSGIVDAKQWLEALDYLAGKPFPDLSSAGMFYRSAHNPYCCAAKGGHER